MRFLLFPVINKLGWTRREILIDRADRVPIFYLGKLENRDIIYLYRTREKIMMVHGCNPQLLLILLYLYICSCGKMER